ncbi:MAG: ribose 5-phosphate isomerase B [Candidatus Marinimicrobia bacterium]|nr:ribose 5-phosphate isomerase B [Candidatus Neomarinimicrobiota bacterium]MCF7839730.1 ribose 5-phosphate isomerase B [Candidatus Neomarinimicrobiota bacterium]
MQEPVDKLRSLKVVAIGADHGGFHLKEALKKVIQDLGYEVEDFGTYSTDAVDYPDIAEKVSRSVARGNSWRGVIIDGAGIGSAIAANKIEGIRAANCIDVTTARNAREHNDTNILSLGSGIIGHQVAGQIVETWLKTPFAGGRHQRRIDKLIALDKMRSKPFGK